MSAGARRKALATKVVLFALALAAIGVFASHALAQAAPVTRTFSNPTPIVIPDSGPATPYPSTIDITGFDVGCTLTDLNVTLHNLSHTLPDNIDILLVGPGGQNAIIMSDVGGEDDAINVTLTLDDQAATPIPTPLVSGTFQPTNAGAGDTFPPPAPAPSGGSALSVFNGPNPNGTSALVYEHQPSCVEATRQPFPQAPGLLIALGGYSGLFLSGQPPGRREILRLIVAVDTSTPKSSSKDSQCSASVRSGLFSSWFGNHCSSIAPFLAGGPGMGLGSTSPLSLRLLNQRLIEGTEIPKMRATSLRGISRSTASNTFSLRSFEYAFMLGSFHEDQPSRNPL